VSKTREGWQCMAVSVFLEAPMRLYVQVNAEVTDNLSLPWIDL
jgi:hypothetical protein